MARAEWTLLRFLMQQKDWRDRANPFKIAFIERDIPGALIAINDLTDKINALLRLSGQEKTFCGFDAVSFCPEYYKDWELHKSFSKQVKTLIKQPDPEKFDLIIDQSILRRTGIENFSSYPKSPENNIVIIRTTFAPNTSQFNAQFKADSHRLLSAKPIVYQPTVLLNERGQFEAIPKIKADLQFFLGNIFRKINFRDGQLPILNRVLQRKNVIGLLPTGGGKSLTYQLAALLQPGVTLVVDPIKSLMQDQFEGLQSVGIDTAGFINSSLSGTEKLVAEDHLRSGAWLFCFISPERLVIKHFRSDVLNNMVGQDIYFSHVVIDEVHCVSEWGHDFRTPYLNLGANAQAHCRSFGGFKVPLIGLTATASFDVLSDVERELFVDTEQESDSLVRYENTNRPELQFRVIDISDYVDYEKDEDFWPEEFKNLPAPIANNEEFTKQKIKERSGQFRQGLTAKLLSNGKDSFSRRLEEYNTDDSIHSILDHESEEYLDELSVNEKDQFKKKYLTWLPLNGNSWQELKIAAGASALVFVPHTKGNFGVTGQYEERWIHEKKQFVPNPNEKGVLEGLKRHNFNAIGTFRGTSNVRDVVADKIEKDNQRNQNQFKNDGLSVMVATKAFGMGIDISNIRTTVHLATPGSLEALIQEAGRAGRDRRLAISFIFIENDPFLHFLPEGVNQTY